jgi:hypothetical protein
MCIEILRILSFFIKWEGKWDIFFNEEMEVAKSEIEKEAGDGFELVN